MQQARPIYINSAKYLIPAYMRLIQDHSTRVHMTVVTDHPGVEIRGPVSGIQEHNIQVVQDARLVEKKKNVLTLNITPDAIGHYFEDHELCRFSARFNGAVVNFVIPWEAIIGVYCADQSMPGLEFHLPYEEKTSLEVALVEKEVPADTPKLIEKASHLRVVK